MVEGAETGGFAVRHTCRLMFQILAGETSERMGLAVTQKYLTNFWYNPSSQSSTREQVDRFQTTLIFRTHLM